MSDNEDIDRRILYTEYDLKAFNKDFKDLLTRWCLNRLVYIDNSLLQNMIDDSVQTTTSNFISLMEKEGVKITCEDLQILIEINL